MAHNLKIKKRAIALRKHGFTLEEIAAKLGVGRRSVARWTAEAGQGQEPRAAEPPPPPAPPRSTPAPTAPANAAGMAAVLRDGAAEFVDLAFAHGNANLAAQGLRAQVDLEAMAASVARRENTTRDEIAVTRGEFERAKWEIYDLMVRVAAQSNECECCHRALHTAAPEPPPFPRPSKPGAAAPEVIAPRAAEAFDRSMRTAKMASAEGNLPATIKALKVGVKAAQVSNSAERVHHAQTSDVSFRMTTTEFDGARKGAMDLLARYRQWPLTCSACGHDLRMAVAQGLELAEAAATRAPSSASRPTF